MQEFEKLNAEVKSVFSLPPTDTERVQIYVEFGASSPQALREQFKFDAAAKQKRAVETVVTGVVTGMLLCFVFSCVTLVRKKQNISENQPMAYSSPEIPYTSGYTATDDPSPAMSVTETDNKMQNSTTVGCTATTAENINLVSTNSFL